MSIRLDIQIGLGESLGDKLGDSLGEKITDHELRVLEFLNSIKLLTIDPYKLKNGPRKAPVPQREFDM